MAEKRVAPKRRRLARHLLVGCVVLVVVCLASLIGIWLYVDKEFGTWTYCEPLASSRLAEGTEDTILPSFHEVALRNEFPISLGERRIGDAALSPNSELVAIDLVNEVQIWETTSGTHLYTFLVAGERVPGLAWSPDGTQVAVGSSTHVPWEVLGYQQTSPSPYWSNRVDVWDIGLEQRVLSVEGTPGDYYNVDFISSLAYSPTGDLLTARSGTGIYVWDAKTGEELCHFYVPDVNTHTTEWHMHIGWRSENSPLLARYVTGRGISTNSVYVWDLGERATILELEGEQDLFVNAFWSPDSTHIVLRSSGAAYGVSPERLTVWDAVTGDLLLSLDDTFFFTWSPDGRRIATSSPDDLFAIWDVETGAQVLSVGENEGEAWAVDWSRDGKTIVAVDSTGLVSVWEIVPSE